MSYYYEGIEENSFTLTEFEATLLDLIDELDLGDLTPQRCKEIADIEERLFQKLSIMLTEEQEIFWEFHCLLLQERLRLLNTNPDGNSAA